MTAFSFRAILSQEECKGSTWVSPLVFLFPSLPGYDDELAEKTGCRDSSTGCLQPHLEGTLLQTLGLAMGQSKAASEKRANGAALLKTAGGRGAGRENDKSDSRTDRWEDAWTHGHTHTYTHMER